MENTNILVIDFQNFWHVGSGHSAGYYVDAVCLKDQFGLPYVAGKQLKGLLRHAVRRAEAWGWYQDLTYPQGKLTSFEELLFGSQSQEQSRHATVSGMLFVDNAKLSDEEYNFLKKNALLKQNMYQELYSTAIDEETGTAKQYSLRGLEAVLPMTLYANLDVKVTELDPVIRQQQEQFLAQDMVWQVLERALPLIDFIGAHRSRGLGEVVVNLKKVA